MGNCLLKRKLIFLRLTSLGSGTSFDLSGYSNYNQLTADDFFVRTDTYVQSNQSDTYSSSSLLEECFISKSYDSSTGILTICNNARVNGYNGNTQTSACDVYLCSKKAHGSGSTVVKQIIDLGTATSFSVKNYYSDYSSLTADNFYYSTYSYGSGRPIVYADESYYARGWAINNAASKSYNSSTGALTFYKPYSSGGPRTGVSGNYSVHAWLIV